jgi:gliding motility-associated-like protein
MRARILFFLSLSYYVSYSQLVVDFSSDKTIGCGRTAIRFDAKVSSGYTSFLWNFGNGQTNSDELRPLVMFDPGNYTVTFTATDGQNSLQKTLDIVIHKAPGASIEFIGKESGCVGETISFRASTTVGDAPITSYKWVYGDGDKGTGLSSSHQYSFANTTPGYPLVLEITDGNNCTYKTYEYVSISGKPKIEIIPNSFFVCDSLSVNFSSQIVSDAGIKSYKWNFGDGASATVANPGIHKYSVAGKYKVSLEATDVNGCINKEDTTVAIFNVKAAINVPDSVCTGDTVNFNAAKSDAKFFKWILYNDTILKESFKRPTTGVDSIYVQLYASNEYCTAYDSSIIRVSSILARFNMDTTWVCTFPHDVQFTDSTEGNVKNYLWDFGDGQTSTLKNPIHRFNKASEIKLKVTSNAGCESETTRELLLKRPKPVIILSDSGGCLPLNVYFIGDSSKAISKITKYTWKVKGWTWDASSQTHFEFTEPIIDTIKLTITDQVCGNETAKLVFKAGNRPIVNFQCKDTFVLTQKNYAINQSQPIDSIDEWLWSADKYSCNARDFSWKPYMDTAYFNSKSGIFTAIKEFPLPGDKINIKLKAGFYTCYNDTERIVTMQGPVVDIIDVFKTSCQLPTQINLDYKIYDAYKMVYYFENLKGGPGLKDSVEFARDTTLNDTVTVTLVPGFYKLYVTVFNLKNKKSHTITYHEWKCPASPGEMECEKRDIVTPVSEVVKANFVTSDTKVCWDKLVKLDASSSENAVLHQWYTSVNGTEPELIYPYLAPSLTKNEPLICAANPILCFLSGIFSNNPNQPCTLSANSGGVDTTKTNIVLCERGWHDIILISTATNGCTDTLKKEKLIKVFKPEVTLTSNDARVCMGDEISFSLQNIIEDTTITSYILNFGDGSNHRLSTSSEVAKKEYSEGVFLPFIALRDTLQCENTIVHTTYKNGDWEPDAVVSSQPHATLTADAVSCKDHLINASSNNGFVSYNWNFGDGYTEGGVNNITSHIYSNPGTYQLMLTVRDTINCIDTARQNVIVVTEPFFSISVDTPYWGCPIAILTIDDVSGNQFIAERTWEMKNVSMDVDDPIISSSSSTIVMPVIFPGVYDISLEIYSEYCGSFSSTFNNMFRMNGPYMKMAKLDENYCRLDSVLLKPDSTSIINNPVFVQWNFDNIDLGETSFSDTVVTKRTFDEPGKYAVMLFYTDTLGCEMTDTASFNIYKLKADFNLPGPICDVPKIFELVNQSQGYDSLVWKMGNKVSNNLNYTDTIFNFGKYPVAIEVYDTNGCYDMKERILAANMRPKGITNQPDTTICLDDTIHLRTFFDPTYRYEWSPLLHINNYYTYNPFVYPKENTTYFVSIIDTSSLCTSGDSINIYIQKIPEISYGYYYLPYGSTGNAFNLDKTSTIRIPLGDSIRFLVTVDQPGVEFLWENSDNLLNCLICQGPVARFMKHSVVGVIPSDSLGCYSQLLQREFELIPVDGQILMPTAFSPNGDDINDIVKVEGPGLEKLIYFRIYNYTGNLLFETTNLSEGWDGKYKGKEQPAGIYFYKVKAKIYNDSREYEKEGAVKLVK